RLEPADYQPRLKIECLRDRNEEVSLQLVKELALLEPLGCDNPPPLFAFKDAVLHYPKTFGRDNNHLRFYTDYGRYSYHSIMCNCAADMVCLYNNAVVDLAFMPKINVWKEKESVNLQVVDYDQALQVYDYRNCNTSKEAVLRNILQTSKKTVIYVNNTSTVPEAAKLPDVQVLAYGEPAEQEAENIIFYDFPQQEVFDADALPVPKGAGKRLLLLYTRSEADKYCVELDKLYPGRSQLVHAYKELACTLRQQAVIDRADLLESAANISEDALKVFEELEFIRDEHGKISFGNLQKNDLQNSPTFRGLQEKGRKAFAGCQRNMNISPEEIIGLWQGKRFDK
ncbi:MAG: single-stranded-DNA-specific exonuclease C-terminal domain-containing protein, partial [Acidaminococcaceae bacterium]|nr:single-stranded-DNA-specific exonuclease C-terminal domain-containing protein [Acidaminococcaceae bacterium]